ncbi:hypothetical protein BDQ17DRAFT_1441658 [Cyathus striatus]|nr:hypothetical protein BDQ17DRAFT_1441658 [Cyathus striatus]
MKAESMFKVLESSLFWHAIARITRHLRPLAMACNVIQSSFCRLDTVLMTFGYLVMEYKKMILMETSDGETTSFGDTESANAIISSIEKHWEKSDQEVFIAAVILNPFYQTKPFAQHDFLTPAGLGTLFGTLWTRFYGTVPPLDLTLDLVKYLTWEHPYSNLQAQCDLEEYRANSAVRLILHLY